MNMYANPDNYEQLTIHLLGPYLGYTTHPNSLQSNLLNIVSACFANIIKLVSFIVSPLQFSLLPTWLKDEKMYIIIRLLPTICNTLFGAKG